MLLIKAIPRLKSLCELRLQEAPRKEIVNHLNASPKAKSVDMLHKGLTTNIFTIHFL